MEERPAESNPSSSKPDLSSLGSMLQARWKGASSDVNAAPEAVRSGQVRKFRITRLDSVTKQIELDLV
jgi:small subunit ribosomal protein S1